MSTSPLREVHWPKFVIAAGFLALACFYAMWAWTDRLTDLGGDSAAYLIISRLYSLFHAPSAAVLAYKDGIVSPPLFPFLLSLADGGYHFLAAHLVVALFALGSVAALYFWLRAGSWNIWTSALIALVFGLLPATILTIFNIWTEFPYLFFSLATIAVLESGEKSPDSSTRTWYIAAVMVACASLIRVAALPLVGAFLLHLVIRRPRRFIVIGLVAAMPFAAWALYSAVRETGAGSYVNQFVNVYSSDPVAKFIAQCRFEYGAVFATWQSGWLGGTFSDLLHTLVTGFWFVCIAGWLYRLATLKFDALYTLLYTILLFLWPHPEEAARYAFVLYPILIANGFQLIAALAGGIPGMSKRVAIPAIAAGLMLLCALPGTAINTKRYLDTPDDYAAARHTQGWYSDNQFSIKGFAQFQNRFFNDLAGLDKLVPPGDCIFAIKPTIITLITDRKSMGPPGTALNDAQFNDGIRRCRFAYVIPFSSTTFAKPLYPMERLGERAKIIDRVDDGAGGLDAALLEIKR